MNRPAGSRAREKGKKGKEGSAKRLCGPARGPVIARSRHKGKERKMRRRKIDIYFWAPNGAGEQGGEEREVASCSLHPFSLSRRERGEKGRFRFLSFFQLREVHDKGKKLFYLLSAKR